MPEKQQNVDVTIKELFKELCPECKKKVALVIVSKQLEN